MAPKYAAAIPLVSLLRLAVLLRSPSTSEGQGGDSHWWCGATHLDAAENCAAPCPDGHGCPVGTACFAGVTSCAPAESASSLLIASASASTALGGMTGPAAVEETFLQMKDKIDNELFLYETPMMEWVPSTVYRFDGFIDGLRVMHEKGVAGKRVYMGGDCAHCHMYGLVNVAAFLAQAMKETIRYDACDENSWDRVGDELMYPISNACGQLGQSYQDYHCSEEERHMECEVDPEMTITAVTNAKWWGAPGPLKCGPRSLYPRTGYWDFLYACDNVWANPPEYCDEYEGQKGGRANNDEPYPNAAGRTDVEGCCWWGRGVIQTSGVCNFGKLNYFLGKRAADEGRESRYPNIDFCRNPEAICSSREHGELKWITGLFYWISDVQSYDNGGWNYLNELHKFVEGGLKGDAFINAVSGIVNRGCHNPPCGTGELDGGAERAHNFFDIIKEMRFSFVEVVPRTPESAVRPESSPPTSGPYLPSFLSASPTAAFPDLIADVVQGPPLEPKAAASEDFRYLCNGYEVDPFGTSVPPSLEVVFDYDLINRIDVTVGDALKDIKRSILSDVAERVLGCHESHLGWGLKVSPDAFGNIVALQSAFNDLPNPDARGCIMDVETDDPATCTPVSGAFMVYTNPGTSESSMLETINNLKEVIKEGMGEGRYETETVVKANYVDRDRFPTPPISPIVQSETGQDDSSEGLKIAIYALACVYVILACLLWFMWCTYKEKVQTGRRKSDEELAFNRFMVGEASGENEYAFRDNMMMTEEVDDGPRVTNHGPPPHPRLRSQNRTQAFQDNSHPEFPQRPHSASGDRGSSSLIQTKAPEQEMSTAASESSSESSAEFSEESSAEDVTMPEVPPTHFQSNSNGRIPSRRREGLSDNCSVSSNSSGDTSEDENLNRRVPATFGRGSRGGETAKAFGGNSFSAKEGVDKYSDSLRTRGDDDDKTPRFGKARGAFTPNPDRLTHTAMPCFANDNNSADGALDAKSTLTPPALCQCNTTLDGASDTISTLTPATPPERDPSLRSQASDRSSQSKSISTLPPATPPERDPSLRSQALDHSVQSEFPIREFYDNVEGWGDYDGELDAEGHRCGNGLMIWDNGEEYKGNWLDNRPHGRGTKAWPKGSTYVGEWKEGLREGWGDMRHADGSRYKGYWRGGIQQGEEKWWSADGSVYEGEWEEGKGIRLTPLQPSAPTAPATLPAAEETSDQEPHIPISSLVISKRSSPRPPSANQIGQGEFGRKEFEDGETWRGVYVGEMDAEGQRCGIGIMTREDGTVYEGRWEDDKPTDGEPTRFANGAEYGGE